MFRPNPIINRNDVPQDATDLITIRDLSARYQKSDRHTRRIIASDDFPKPFRLGLTGRTLYWHFDDIVAWEKAQRTAEPEAA